jgi:hypothetical protein
MLARVGPDLDVDVAVVAGDLVRRTQPVTVTICRSRVFRGELESDGFLGAGPPEHVADAHLSGRSDVESGGCLAHLHGLTLMLRARVGAGRDRESLSRGDGG